jgi:hypothetical protein
MRDVMVRREIHSDASLMRDSCDVFATVAHYHRQHDERYRQIDRTDPLPILPAASLAGGHSRPWRILATYIPSGEQRLFNNLEDCLAFIKKQADATNAPLDDIGDGND